ncbi:MAG: UDP-N-acetylmuramate dehydrogenase [Parcubacteria group bacterium Gr01-1014_31]|nr:MAG: UDP-N-acetylmuramate dehydrogenase [Parcubacteria group bacterium Gr01-1014_31]
MATLPALRGIIPSLQENVLLKPYTTFKIGGPARFLCRADSADAMVQALQAAARAELPQLVLGEGSNVLISDAGFPGLVILDRNTEFRIDGATVTCGGGLKTMELLQRCADRGLGGMEFMAGIPGTVGAAVRGNAGAWGKGFGELCQEVTCFLGGAVVQLRPADLQLAYRYSVLRSKPGVVLSVKILLAKRPAEQVAREAADIVRKRNERIPPDPSIGSIFKNIDLKTAQLDEVKLCRALDTTEEEFRAKTKYRKLPVGFLTERLGLRGMRIGGAQLSNQHGNIIINPEQKATADDVAQLIAFIKTRIRNQAGIQLEEEIQYVGY